MKDKKFNDYFIDITFKIMPKKFRPNKIMTIATVDKDNNKTLIISFVCLNKWIVNPIIKYLNI